MSDETIVKPSSSTKDGSWQIGYLSSPSDAEQMQVAYSGQQIDPHTHSIYYGDLFAKHDVACHVCFSRSAILNMGIGGLNFSPCYDCQKQGWSYLKVPKWLNWIKGFMRSDR